MRRCCASTCARCVSKTATCVYCPVISKGSYSQRTTARFLPSAASWVIAPHPFHTLLALSRRISAITAHTPPLPPHIRDHRAYPFSLRTLTAIVPRLRPLWGYPEPRAYALAWAHLARNAPPQLKDCLRAAARHACSQFPTGDVRSAKTPAQARCALQTG